jgi:hypothetical protein
MYGEKNREHRSQAKEILKRIIKTSHLGPTMSGNNNKLTINRTHLSLFGMKNELGEVLHMRTGVD